jgi:hypothetical protein
LAIMEIEMGEKELNDPASYIAKVQNLNEADLSQAEKMGYYKTIINKKNKKQ